jgi:hypothetical protein
MYQTGYTEVMLLQNEEFSAWNSVPLSPLKASHGGSVIIMIRLRTEGAGFDS